MIDLNTHIDTLVHYDDFPETIDVQNIEFGAGKGFFGKIEFPNCFLTDQSDYQIKHFTEVDEVKFGSCHFLDGLADYFNYDFKGKKFRKLIFCNPFGMGLSKKFEGIKFLDRANDLLEVNGEIFLLGQHANQFVKKKNVEKRINEYNLEFSDKKWKIDSELNSAELMDLNSKHTFCTSTGKAIVPNIGFVLKRWL